MKYVDAVVTADNVYVNVHTDKTLSATSWDIHNTKRFQPFLSKSARDKFFPEKIRTIQKEIIYEDTNAEYVALLEKRISQFIAEKIESHRFNAPGGIGMPTRWNKKFGEQIKHHLLMTFENFKYTMRPGAADLSVSKDKALDALAQLELIRRVDYSQLASRK